MSPRHFSRLYKLKTGITPAKAIEVFRLEAARRMLEDSDRNVTQIGPSVRFWRRRAHANNIPARPLCLAARLSPAVLNWDEST